jgi:2,5-dihydroxypyridine 5,6-dioxygenase
MTTATKPERPLWLVADGQAADLNEPVDLIEAMLRLQKIEAGQKVILVTTTEYDTTEIHDYRLALGRIGAESIHIVIPPLANGPTNKQPGTDLFYSVVEHAEFLLFPWSSCRGERPILPSIHDRRVIEFLERGGRALHVQSPLSKIREMWPTEDMIQRTLAGAELMENASTIRITSPSGTDLVMDKSGRPAHTQHGIADVPGRWDNFAFGCVSSTPHEDSASGVLVVEPPAAISPLVSFAHDQIKLTIKGGKIVEIAGGLEAKLLRRYLEMSGDPESFGTSHVGWGTHKRAGIGAGGGWLNLVSYLHNAYGTLLIAFGDSYHPRTAKFSGGGGQRHARSHCDIGGLEVDFYLDDKLICSGGQIVEPSCK